MWRRPRDVLDLSNVGLGEGNPGTGRVKMVRFFPLSDYLQIADTSSTPTACLWLFATVT